MKVSGGTAAGTVPRAYCRKGDELKSAYVPPNWLKFGSTTKVPAAVVAADPEGVPKAWWGEGTSLLLLLRSSAAVITYWAAAGTAYAELSTCRSYLETVAVAVAILFAVLILPRHLRLGCHLGLHLGLHGRCLGSDERPG